MAHHMQRYQDLTTDSARWAQYRPRPGDVIISTPPKSGTTLVQMLCALLIFDRPDLPGPMDELSPWFDFQMRSDTEVLDLVEAQQHRRFLKTHTPLDGLPVVPDVTYVASARDPRDIFVSWQHHEANIDLDRAVRAYKTAGTVEHMVSHLRPLPDAIEERFDRFIDERDPTTFLSLARVLHQVGVAWERRHDPDVVLVHFADLRDDPAAVMATMAARMGVEISEARIETLVAAAAIDTMREQAHTLAPNTKGIFTDPRGFFRAGTGGEWRTFVTPAQEARYWDRVTELTTSQISDWLHRA